MKMEIQKITNQFKTPEIYKIYNSCMYMPTWEKFSALADEYIMNEHIQIYAAYDGEIPNGVLVVSSGDKAKFLILGIAVDSRCRGKGIGSQLIFFIKNFNSEATVYAQTDEDAVVFYKKCGFQTTKIEKQYGNDVCIRYDCIL